MAEQRTTVCGTLCAILIYVVPRPAPLEFMNKFVVRKGEAHRGSASVVGISLLGVSLGCNDYH
jgi:hypothetical protein